MAQTVELVAADDHKLNAYHVPAGGGGRRGGIVVIQEIFGVNEHIRAVSDGYAEQGYEVYAPQLFDRAQRDVELGYTESDIAEGFALRNKLDWNGPLLDVQAAVAELRAKGEVGVVGYCWGGSVTWLAACRAVGVSAASCYYGGQIAELVDNKPRCPTMCHFGERDKMIPMSDVDKVKAAHPDVEVFVYPADHGFNCDHRASYDEVSSKLALERTLAHFAKHVG